MSRISSGVRESLVEGKITFPLWLQRFPRCNLTWFNQQQDTHQIVGVCQITPTLKVLESRISFTITITVTAIAIAIIVVTSTIAAILLRISSVLGSVFWGHGLGRKGLQALDAGVVPCSLKFSSVTRACARLKTARRLWRGLQLAGARAQQKGGPRQRGGAFFGTDSRICERLPASWRARWRPAHRSPPSPSPRTEKTLRVTSPVCPAHFWQAPFDAAFP